MRYFLLFSAICIFLDAATPVSGTVPEPYDSVFHPDDEGEVLVRDLARVFVSEAGFNDPIEHAALGHTLARRARHLRRVRGWGARQTIRTISDRTLVSPLTNRQRWLHALDLTGSRPRQWGQWTQAPWQSEGWKVAITEARDLIAGRVADPCRGPSQLWGSRYADREAIASGLQRGTWAVVDCGLEETADDNVYVRWTTRQERRDHRRGRR